MKKELKIWIFENNRILKILKFRNYIEGQYKWQYMALFLSLLPSFEHFFCPNSEKIKSYFFRISQKKIIFDLQVRDLKCPFWVICNFEYGNYPYGFLWENHSVYVGKILVRPLGGIFDPKNVKNPPWYSEFL